ncbi:Phosphinothricin N-acetyltransferase [Tepidimonas alkaliphilus]|uniref:Phosphinothricin N-acetyltransferase n=1 Tax=Tepidimonas alkaliphilus TaxID=2588942 RepID=A0A554W4Z5_9BURK|nr:GNAT family N-acetyltransferase [Tepidimonas alkaliphilus]TSE18652.1 Phosphinothricin N-acetyltransferase [Tepidimonas alkaliphilus]
MLQTCHYTRRLVKSILIRPSREEDLAAIAALYAHHVLHGTGTFETEPPSVAEMAARRADVLAKGLPWLVAEVDGAVQGFAYGNWFKPRPAYRYSVEDSIYVAPQTVGRGLGRALLAELLAQLEARGIRKVMAVIGDSANAASIGLHTALGFTRVGVVRACGWKFGRWLDIVLMERALGWGDRTPPDDGAAGTGSAAAAS